MPQDPTKVPKADRKNWFIDPMKGQYRRAAAGKDSLGQPQFDADEENLAKARKRMLQMLKRTK